MTILVLEDDPIMQRLLERFLSETKYDLQSATNANTALTMALASPPDIVICDQHLQDSPPGVWFMQQLREHSVRAAMILLTGDERIPPRESLREGVVAYLIKPVTKEQVLEAVIEAEAWLKVTRPKPAE